MPELLLDSAETSRRLSIGDRTLRRLKASGVLPHVRLGARTVRYREADVDRLARTGWTGGDQ